MTFAEIKEMLEDFAFDPDTTEVYTLMLPCYVGRSLEIAHEMMETDHD